MSYKQYNECIKSDEFYENCRTLIWTKEDQIQLEKENQKRFEKCIENGSKEEYCETETLYTKSA